MTESATSSASALPRSSGEIEQLLCKVSGANDILLAYINSRGGPSSMRSAASCRQKPNGWSTRRAQWPSVTPHSSGQRPALRKNRPVADALIEIIKVADGEIEIIWKI